ncbi:hypothetical protein [Moorena sp. SIOASIH]|uniref:hypothetical protein n=1 Tax=Moorena sp. SIOASIH TaxID=2607817 RepID=UPI0025E3C714|nr:hypothetical protein [Moorena sp. SIOASIH]
MNPMVGSNHTLSKAYHRDYTYCPPYINYSLYLTKFKTAVMKQTHYLTTTVQQGNRLEISLPNLPVGQTIEVILIVPKTTQNQSIERQDFQQLTLEERRRLLAQQAEAMKDYYQENEEWKDWINFDNE